MHPGGRRRPGGLELGQGGIEVGISIDSKMKYGNWVTFCVVLFYFKVTYSISKMSSN